MLGARSLRASGVMESSAEAASRHRNVRTATAHGATANHRRCAHAKGKHGSVVAAAAAGALALALSAGPAEAGKPNIMESCKICHQAADGVVRGKMVSVSGRIQEPERHGRAAGLDRQVRRRPQGEGGREDQRRGGPEDDPARPRDRRHVHRRTRRRPVAAQVAVKQPYKVAAEKLIAVEKMQELVAQGPEAGKFTLVDSRPGPMYRRGAHPRRDLAPLRGLQGEGGRRAARRTRGRS